MIASKKANPDVPVVCISGYNVQSRYADANIQKQVEIIDLMIEKYPQLVEG